MAEAGAWRNCNVCKSPIAYGATYWVCSVSTCNQKRTRLHFCTVSCWDAHLPGARHRTAWAEEETAPRGPEANRATDHSAKPPAKKPGPRAKPVAQSARPQDPDSAPAKELLIVASRLKDYIRQRSGMNTSERVLGPLSDAVREICDGAIEHARRAERQTVLDRDVPSEDDKQPAWLSR